MQLELSAEFGFLHELLVCQLDPENFRAVGVLGVRPQRSFRPGLRHRYVSGDAFASFVQIIYDVIVVVVPVVGEVLVG